MELTKVIRTLKGFANPELAEKWDNVGLLLEPTNCLVSKVLLTNDLTEKVLDEALKKKVNLIVSYHPPIFSAFKRLSQDSWKSRILIKCMENSIALYSPHTSWDHVRGGVNDWLTKAFSENVHEMEYIAPLRKEHESVEGGVGRRLILRNAIPFEEAVRLIKKHTGLTSVRVAQPETAKTIQTIVLCAGSGSSVFSLATCESDLMITGEMSHHDVLDAVHKGSYVVLCEHSNSERGFLNVFKEILKEREAGLEVLVSECDADPLTVS